MPHFSNASPNKAFGAEASKVILVGVSLWAGIQVAGCSIALLNWSGGEIKSFQPPARVTTTRLEDQGQKTPVEK